MCERERVGSWNGREHHAHSCIVLALKARAAAASCCCARIINDGKHLALQARDVVENTARHLLDGDLHAQSDGGGDR